MSDRKSIVKLATAAFEKLLATHGTLFVLPRRCQGTHIFVPHKGAHEATRSTVGLHFKLSVVTQAGAALATNSKLANFGGMIVIWHSEDERLIMAPLQDFTSTGYKTCLKEMDENVMKKSEFVTTISQHSDVERWVSYDQATSIYVKREFEPSNSNNAKEAMAQKDIANLFHEGEYKQTNEGCLADAYLSIRNPLILPLQIKSSCLNKSKAYQFGGCTGYDGMLVLCRPMPYVGFTAVIPGDLCKATIHFSAESKTYKPFFVDDLRLAGVLRDIDQAITDKKTLYELPSGKEISLLNMTKISEQDVNLPLSINHQIELSNFDWRQAMFPDLSYSRPVSQNSVVDVYINTVSVQDKMASKAIRGEYFDVSLRKSGGLVNGKRTHQPYSALDWEALWIFMPDRQSVFFIPNAELKQRGVLSCAAHVGRMGITVYPKYYAGQGDNWASSFRYDIDDPHVSIKLAAAIAKCVQR